MAVAFGRVGALCVAVLPVPIDDADEVGPAPGALRAPARAAAQVARGRGAPWSGNCSTGPAQDTSPRSAPIPSVSRTSGRPPEVDPSHSARMYFFRPPMARPPFASNTACLAAASGLKYTRNRTVAGQSATIAHRHQELDASKLRGSGRTPKSSRDDSCSLTKCTGYEKSLS